MKALTSLNQRQTCERGLLWVLGSLRAILPKGVGLSQLDWQIRHRFLLLLLWMHVVTFPLVGWTFARPVIEGFVAAAIVGMLAFVGNVGKGSHRTQSCVVSMGLATASGFVVHLSGGYIEFHFHYFVLATLLVLYQDWAPFLIMITFVALEHGVLGVIHPHSVYNHPAAIASPVAWAALHSVYIGAACMASIVAWRKSEQAGEVVRAAHHCLAQEVERRKIAEQTLQQAHHELEMKVQQRTADLKETNEALTQAMVERRRAEESLRQEIEERKQVEQALRQSEMFNRAMIESSQDFITVLDLDGRLLYMNQGGQEKTDLGYKLNASWIKFWHPEDQPAVRAAIRHAGTGGVGRLELYCSTMTPKPRWWNVVISPIRDSAGRIDRVLAASHDITERKHGEEALRESEARFRALADHITQLAWMTDETGWIFWYNERWFEYTGTMLDEMQGWGWQKVHHADHLARVVEGWQRAHETGEPWEDTFPLRGKDGQYRWFLSRATPIRDEQGRVVRWFGTNTDITEQREAEKDIRRLLQEAEARERELKEKQENLIQAAKLASIGELVSGIAHELNNPLNNIALFAGNLLDSLDANTWDREHARTSLQRTVHQVQKAGTIINELRTFSRTTKSEKTHVRVSQVIESALMLLQEQFRLASITVETNLSGQPVVMGNAIQLEQVLINLLTNAKDALEGIEEKRLIIRSVTRKSGVEVAVHDSGCGMASDIATRIFDPFFTTKAVGKGTGLGLSISYGIIKEHGGTITVESSPGQGTCFMVRLPLAEPIV